MKKIKKTVLLVVLFGFGFLAGGFWVTVRWIQNSVEDRCVLALEKYKEGLPEESGCVEGLMMVLEDEDNSFRERNHAIWALGQIGDTKAKELVESYFTGNIPDREPFDEVLSQYEMKKALKLLDGGLNITHLVWKYEN